MTQSIHKQGRVVRYHQPLILSYSPQDYDDYDITQQAIAKYMKRRQRAKDRKTRQVDNREPKCKLLKNVSTR